MTTRGRGVTEVPAKVPRVLVMIPIVLAIKKRHPHGTIGYL
ncbi:hypothetical protein CsSME_00049988 [Camellia sinensis var. sinensis]